MLRHSIVAFVVIWGLNCATELADAPGNVSDAPGLDTKPSCETPNRPAILPADLTFDSNPTGFTHISTTDQLIAQGGKGVLGSTVSEKNDILISTEHLKSSTAKIQADFSTATGMVSVFLHSDEALTQFYEAEVRSSGKIVLGRLSGNSGGSIDLHTFNYMPVGQLSGTIELTVCGTKATATANGVSISITTAPLHVDGFGFGVRDGGAIDNVAVFVP